MRIHQILETCVEYVAYDGALGSDPSTLLNHLRKLDGSIDQDYFEHIYGSLIAHPAIQLIITRHPLQPADGPVLLGTAPLPDDFDIEAASKANLDVERLIVQGVRGRQLAFRIAGLEYQTDKETMDANREAKRLKAKASKTKQQDAEDTPGEEQEALMQFIGDDDGGEGENKVLRTDFKGLVAKWGSRFRIRATDEEIYYRLTGTHERSNKISEKVFLSLQLAARSRERGISAVELGPAVGASQGSVHYFMKVLKKMGLCAGVPVALPGGMSSLLIFHPFVEQNAVYRDAQRLPPLEDDGDGDVVDASSSRPETPLGTADLDEDSDGDEDAVAPGDLGIEFGPITESELVAGHIVKQRLVQLLDNPRLQNHLLGRRNIGPLLGWHHTGILRYRRAMQRHVDALVHEGIVEIVLVGERRARCLRLTKYNPDFVLPAMESKEENEEQEIVELPPDEQLLSENATTFQYKSQANLIEPLEYQINKLVAQSGPSGMTIADVRDSLDNAHRRTVEKHFDRCDKTYVPPHLRDLQICTTLESYGREKRTRAFTVHAYRQLLLDGGAPVDDGQYPPPTEEVGHFSDLENRDLYDDPSEINTFLRRWLYGGNVSKQRILREGMPYKRGRPRKTDYEGDEEETEDQSPATKKMRKYKNDVQARGRPRKYIHIVREDGTVDRHIVKQVLPHPDLAPIYIHVVSAKKLVPAPEGYTGVGKPPTLDEETIKNGKDYAFFKRYPAKDSKGKVKTEIVDDTVSESPALVEDLVATPQPEASTSTPVAEAPPPPPAVEEAPVLPKKRGRPKKNAVQASPAVAPTIAEDPFVAGPSAAQASPPTAEVQVEAAPAAVDDSSTVAAEASTPAPAEQTAELATTRATRSRKRKVRSPVTEPPLVPPPATPAPVPEPPKKQKVHVEKVQEFEASVAPASATDRPPTFEPMTAAGVQSITATPGAPPTPISAEPYTPLPRHVQESTPLLDLTPKTESDLTATTKGKVPQRLLLPHLRRMNELAQTIRDLGGVTTTNKLIHQHTDWSKRVAGTDHPHSPAIATQMDRQTFQRTLKGMLEEGRVKQTRHVAPSHTGRYTQTEVVYLPDISPEVLRTFNRELSVTVSQAFIPVHTPRTMIDDAAFTSVRLPTPNTLTKASRSQNVILAVSKAREAAAKDYANPDLKPEDRRAALLRDHAVISVLFGYISGRFARSAFFHRTLIRAMSATPTSSSVVSEDPRVFSLELLFNEFTVSEWFQLVTCSRYNEDLEAFIRDPATKDTKLVDMPDHLRPPGGFGGSKNKNKLRVLLQTLAYFKLVAPLALITEGDASEVVCKGQIMGDEVSFKTAPSISEAMYFRLYEAAPVYHVATDAASLLGVASAKTLEEASTFWRISQIACLNQDANAVPRIQHIALQPGSTAPLTEALEVGVDTLKLLRTKKKWRPDPSLLDVQRDALHSFVESEHGAGKEKTAEEVEKFAWEYAIDRRFVDDKLYNRRHRSHVRSSALGSEEAEALRERKKKAEEELRRKVEAINQDAKAEWEKTIAAAAERNGVQPSPELGDYLHRYVLQSTAVVKRGRLSSDILDAGCRAFKRADGHPEAQRPVVFRRPGHGGRQAKPKPAKEPRDPNVKQSRRRKNWSEEDDERLLDAEAIIRARSAHLPGNKGRQAMVQIFPDVGFNVLLNRLKKMWAMPNGQAYFDRLVQAWSAIWVGHRGTDALPDPNPTSLTDFDLKLHLDFLRAKVNKARIRLAASAGAPIPASGIIVADAINDLPADIKVLADELVWDEGPSRDITLEAVWDPQTMVNRIKDITQVPLIDEDVKPDISIPADPRRGLLKSVLKAMVATPPNEFLPSYNELVISPFNSDEIDKAAHELTENKVVRKDKAAAADGRLYQFQQSWQQSTEGPFPEELFSEADGLRTAFENNQGVIEWPIIGKAGETAALMNMISNHQVEFDLDPATFPTLIYLEDSFKTRSLSDLDIEFPVSIRRTASFVERPVAKMPPVNAVSSKPTWDIIGDADEASVNCALQVVRNAGQNGLTKSQIQATLPNPHELQTLLAALSEHNTFWAGYDTGRLVHSAFEKEWTIKSHPPVLDNDGRIIDYDHDSEIWTVPRFWVDLFGRQIADQWARARRNVLGVIVSRPGLTERTLRDKLANILDRLEVNLVLQSLIDSGTIVRSIVNGHEHTTYPLSPICATDAEEENRVVLLPSSDNFWN